MRAAFLTIALSALPVLPAAAADQRGERMELMEQTRQGKLIPVREIERRIVPGVPGAQYLGFDFDSASGIYTLKFLRNGNVIWVEVDGHSGQVIGRSGN
ncbi:hypothetical protein [Sphingomonas sp.]|uniref:hypothetical protein n=1 Tax=Sphingomonas sp. TaxID=28214 RepID=UPI0025F3760A|nr:hypothetical protein [Sphingomonas sp.]